MADFEQPRPPVFTPAESAPAPVPQRVAAPVQVPIPLVKVVENNQKAQLHETRRATFSAQMMQALLMHNGANASEANLTRMASMAVRCADLLLAELEKPTKG